MRITAPVFYLLLTITVTATLAGIGRASTVAGPGQTTTLTGRQTATLAALGQTTTVAGHDQRANPTPLDTAAVERHVQSWLRRARLPAAAVAIVRDGKVVHGRGYSRSVTGPASQLTAETPLLLGSVSKSITAYAAVALAGKGLLELDSPAVHYLPGLRFAGHAPLFTVRHLLQHRTGISRADGMRDFNGARQAPLDYPDVQLTSGPGAVFEYSNLNYTLLGRLLEEVTGSSYAQVVRGEVFEPLGMTASSAEPLRARASVAPGSAFLYLLPIQSHEPGYAQAAVPAGYVAASAADLGRLLVAQMDTMTVSAQARSAEMQLPGGGDEIGYALGWMVSRREDGTRLISHDGLIGRYAAAIGYLPEAGVGAVVLLNSNAGIFQPVAADMMHDLLTIAEGGDPSAPARTEIIVRGVILFTMLLALLSFSRRAVQWIVAGRPVSRAAALRDWVAPAMGAALALAAVIIVPIWFGVSIGTMLTMQPDLGVALLTGGLLAVPDALLKIWLRARKRRLAAYVRNNSDTDRFAVSQRVAR